MRKALKIAGVVLVVLIVSFLAMLVVMRSHTPGIDGDNSIAVLEPTKIGEVEQYVLIRGANKSNPVLLFLHGGPGMPMMYLAHAFQRDLEKHFTVVQWDQRGAGKSYDEDIDVATMNVEQFISDTVELSHLLCNRLRKDKIYLAGHSWGSYLGMIVVSRRPDLFNAYIGIGQVVHGERSNEIQNRFIRRRAVAEGNHEALDDLDGYGASAHEKWLFRFNAELADATSWTPLLMTGLGSPEYGFFDFFKIAPGSNFCSRHMVYNAIDGELMDEITEVDVPVYFFAGRSDYTTPHELAVEYLNTLRAPRKKLVWFEDSAHFPFFEEPDEFTKEMLTVLKETSRP
jgi:pimeloyl-ACP methyl ester carboxylesterase